MADDVDRAFSGYGMALRREEDPPIPGEPLMSMAEAKRITRELLAAASHPRHADDIFVIEQALAAYRDEYDRWATRQLLPARAGKPINEWMEVEATSPMDVLRRTNPASELHGAFETVFTGPGHEAQTEFFKRREVAAMRAALAAAQH